jgi:hypothetical protein
VVQRHGSWKEKGKKRGMDINKKCNYRGRDEDQDEKERKRKEEGDS